MQTLPFSRLVAACVSNAMRRLALSFSFILALFSLALPSQAWADVTITSTGPLTPVGIKTNGDLFASRVPEGQLFFGNTAIWAVYDVTNNAMYSSGYAIYGSTWTPVSQTGPVGTGTAANPYKVTVTVASAAGGFTAVITMTYVEGAESFGTSAQITDTSGAARDLRIFLGADLFYAGNDRGIAIYDPATGSVGGIGLDAANNPNGLVGWFTPITPADHYYSGNYSTTWSLINARQLTDTVDCAITYCDNGAALQWNVTLPANGTTPPIQVGQIFNPDLALLPPSLSNGVVGVAYTQPFTAFGGIAPYTVSLQSGTASLPPGLTFNTTTNTLSGTPSAAGSFTFTLHVIDSDTPQQAQDVTYTVLIVAGLSLQPATLTSGTLNNPYSAVLTPGGGTAPYTVALQSGALPTGLAFDPTTNTLSGTPTSASSFTFTFRVTDSSTPTPLVKDFQYTMTIIDPNSIPIGSAAPVPTLGSGALMALMLALGLAAFGATRRRA